MDNKKKALWKIYKELLFVFIYKWVNKLSKKYIENKTDEQKQKQKDYQKKCRENMTDEQKQKYIEAQKHRYHNMTDE